MRTGANASDRRSSAYDRPMFATLLGALPMPPVSDGVEPRSPSALDRAIEAVIRAQEEAGLEPITDGRLADRELERFVEWAPGTVVDRWRRAAALTNRAVKRALPGPYTLGRLGAGDDLGARGLDSNARQERARRTLAFADSLRLEVEALAAAGCPLVEIEESHAHRIGTDPVERRLFREAQHRLADGVTGTHLSLSIVGGAAHEAGIETILDAPYASLAVDLIAGPENWNLVTRAPGDRGVIAGVESARAVDEPKEVVLWAAHYAASTRGRGLDRVGIGSAASYANLTWDVAVRKMRILGEAARLAAMPAGEELARSLDPRALDARRAALGHDAPSRSGRSSRSRRPDEE
jgi:methionine synthase II (cobalamin-independent)